MKNVIFLHLFALSGLLSFPVVAFSHSADDPIEEIHEYDLRVRGQQNDYSLLASTEERIQNLEIQIETLQRKVFTIKNLMASDYPHVKKKMSKYKYDYIDGIEDTIKHLKSTLKQSKIMLKKAE